MDHRKTFPNLGRSEIVKHSVQISGHKTSISLEAGFWNAAKEIAAAQGRSVHDLVTEIDHSRQHSNLSSAIRLFVLDYFRRSYNETAATRPDLHDTRGVRRPS